MRESTLLSSTLSRNPAVLQVRGRGLPLLCEFAPRERGLDSCQEVSL